MSALLPLRDAATYSPPSTSLDETTLSDTTNIVNAVRAEGDEALRRFIQQFEGRSAESLVLGRSELKAAAQRCEQTVVDLLNRTAERIRSFADAQRNCLTSLKTAIPGGFAGHNLAPVRKAACYAPGGRFPLPSSVLMTAITARSAGVQEVWVVTPSSNDVMLAAAYISGADGLILAGGAHAIAGVAWGTETLPAVDMIVGPGNRWVTAAKQLVSGQVGIDMLAGPSELLVMADEEADASLVAADLIAQAEHDPDAVPILLTTSARVVKDVQGALEEILRDLDTADTARASLRQGASLVCDNWKEATELANRLGPEHLEVQVENPIALADMLDNYGGLFIGAGSAEVIGDYGAGPNHVLPTSGTSRYRGGLSVFDFLRIRTWIRIDAPGDASCLYSDAEDLAGLEGLSGHGLSAGRRSQSH